MLSEPLTLYKLMILYMLKQIKSSMSNSQIAEFFLTKEYTTYFTLQQAFNELLDARLIRQEAVHSNTLYTITRDGEETLSFFGGKISTPIKEDIDQFLSDNRIRLRDETGVVADYYRSTNQDYTVHCEVREGKTPLFTVEVSVPDKAEAEAMCANWPDASQEIYATIMKALLK